MYLYRKSAIKYLYTDTYSLPTKKTKTGETKTKIKTKKDHKKASGRAVKKSKKKAESTSKSSKKAKTPKKSEKRGSKEKNGKKKKGKKKKEKEKASDSDGDAVPDAIPADQDDLAEQILAQLGVAADPMPASVPTGDAQASVVAQVRQGKRKRATELEAESKPSPLTTVYVDGIDYDSTEKDLRYFLQNTAAFSDRPVWIKHCTSAQTLATLHLVNLTIPRLHAGSRERVHTAVRRERMTRSRHPAVCYSNQQGRANVVG